MKPFSFSKFSIILVLAISLIVAANNQKWKQSVIVWDVISYYAYLPGAFIYNDLTFSFLDKDTTGLTTKIWTGKTEDNRRFIKMTSGLSIMYSPFFFMAHGVCLMQPDKYPPDGYSMVYSLFLILSDIFYTIIGFVFLRKIMLRYFSDYVTGTSIIIVFIGTNMFYYTIYEVMSHCYLFCLITMFIYYTLKWDEAITIRRSIILGLLLGLITLIRPVDIIVVLIWLLYGVYSISTLKNRISHLWQNKQHVFLMAGLTVAVFSIQLCYWKYATGSWLYWSYSEEGFFWSKPHILDGFFSFRKGWFIYTPVMLFATIGLMFLYKTEKRFLVPFLTVFVLYSYIIFSWWCWWYGGGLSARPMIDLHAVMAIGLGSFITFIFSFKNQLIKYAASLLICMFTCYGVFTTVQYHFGILHFDSMTYDSWRKGFLTFFVPGDYYQSLSTPNYEKAMKEGNE